MVSTAAIPSMPREVGKLSSFTGMWTAWPVGTLHLWHLLDLDAPAVAFVWALLLSPHAPHRGLQAFALSLAVWLIYAADRLLDAKRCVGPREAVHAFHWRYRAGFAVGLVCCGTLLAALLPHLPLQVCTLWMCLGAPLALYCFAVHYLHLPQPAKGALVCIFFATATAIPGWVAGSNRNGMVDALLFALLCIGNLLVIGTGSTEATRSSRPSRTRQIALAAVALAGCLAMLLVADRPSAAFLLSACALCLLHALRTRASRLTVRALADAALLLPLLLLAIHV